MYADTSRPAASACALIALWIAGSVEIENRVFAMTYGNTPYYGPGVARRFEAALADALPYAWTWEPTPRSRRIDSRMTNAVLAV